MLNDSHHFWEAWQSHCQNLLKKCMRRMGNTADAEDALSTAMLRALEAFPRQAPRLLNMEAWLTRILYNTCVDLHRRSLHQAPAPWEEKEGGSGTGDVPPSELPSPEQHLLQHEQFLALRRQFAALPEPLRRPWAMRFEQGMAYEEIARELRLSVGNVRRRIFLSRRHLRSTLR
ncbi:MAG TPA: sigma-70 family RNA polymerase sigma factor [Hyalangium sp.]|nr:sigma-70 family RNA polymerase sigma factor [Hyalangium sp.]